MRVWCKSDAWNACLPLWLNATYNQQKDRKFKVYNYPTLLNHFLLEILHFVCCGVVVMLFENVNLKKKMLTKQGYVYLFSNNHHNNNNMLRYRAQEGDTDWVDGDGKDTFGDSVGSEPVGYLGLLLVQLGVPSNIGLLWSESVVTPARCNSSTLGVKDLTITINWTKLLPLETKKIFTAV